MFRLRLSNNIPELTNSSNQKMSNRNQTPLRKNSNLQKLNMNNNNNNINSKISSSFNTYTMNSKANSLSTTPDKLLPMIMMKKIKNSKKSIASNSTKISRYSSDLSDDTNLDSSSVENCDCILCATDLARKQTKRKIAQPNEMYLVDSKNFVNCLNTLKPTIKYDRENNQFSDVNYVGSSQQINSDFNSLNSESTLIKIKNNNQVIKLIPANSRIKLWDSNEVTNYIDSNRRASTEMKKVSRNQSKTEVITTNNNNYNTVSDRQSRLAKIFKEFRINPNLTPLIYRNNLVTSIGFQENTTVPIIKNMPITSVTTRTTPTNVYRVSDKNSLTFIQNINRFLILIFEKKKVPAPSALNYYDF